VRRRRERRVRRRRERRERRERRTTSKKRKRKRRKEKSKKKEKKKKKQKKLCVQVLCVPEKLIRRFKREINNLSKQMATSQIDILELWTDCLQEANLHSYVEYLLEGTEAEFTPPDDSYLQDIEDVWTSFVRDVSEEHQVDLSAQSWKQLELTALSRRQEEEEGEGEDDKE
jgi:hypothetical protein